MEAHVQDFIGTYKGLWSPEECDELVRRFDVCQQHNLTSNRQQDEGISKTLKQDDQLFFDTARYSDHIDASSLGSDTQRHFYKTFWENAYDHYAKTYDILGTAAQHSIFQLKLQKTEIGEGYHMWHFESASRDVGGRLLSFILYLNDVEEGGETEFLYQHKRVKPEKGTLVLFPASFTHTHRGNPPLSNSKYIITGWVEY